MWELDHEESWVPKIDAFELWHWRRLLRVPWTARGSNQSILKEISPEYSLEGLMLNLKSNNLAAWCEEPTHWKRPYAGKDWGQEEKGVTGWDGLMASLTPWTWIWADSGDSEGQGSLACCSPWGCKESDMTEQLNNDNNLIEVSLYVIGSFLPLLRFSQFLSTI